MALVGSMGAYQEFGLWVEGDKTRKMVDYLQTSGSAQTQGVIKIIGSATASNDFWLTNFSIIVSDATSSAAITAYMATTTLAVLPPGTVGTIHLNYGPIGINGCTTTTHTVSVITSGATATVQWIVQGYKRI